MGATPLDAARVIRDSIRSLGFDIYEPLGEHPEAVYSRRQIEALLADALIGESFEAPVRTRAKLAKRAVAVALGYPAPRVLRKTRPRFPGQDLDVFVQQSRNLQIWNDVVSATRRYAILCLDGASRVRMVRVVDGIELATFDRTGALTSKYQARRRSRRGGSALVTQTDTDPFVRELLPVDTLSPLVLRGLRAGEAPVPGHVLTVQALHRILSELVGRELPYSPSERRRGAELHASACEILGLADHSDSGRFPDIACQALEVKLQMASTIDLGLVSPDSTDPAVTLSPRLRHCDVRYLVAYATRRGDSLCVDSVVTSTGARFFEEFQRFGGLERNRKLQLRLPHEVCDTK